jgi:hypothetical protein
MDSNSKLSISDTNKKRISSKALFALVFYLILPTCAILMIMGIYPQLNHDRLFAILSRIIPISFVLIVISQFQVRYEKGSMGRFILNEFYVIMLVIWIMAFLGGQPVIYQTWEEYSFSLHIWNYLAVIFFVTTMNVLYYIVEYMAFSEEEETTKEISEDPVISEVEQHKGVTITTVPAK